MKKHVWLRCKASQGQFSDELAVCVRDFQGDEDSLFVDRSLVEPDGDPNVEEVAAHVHVTELDRAGGLVLVRLPSQTFGNGYMITVKEDDVCEHLACEPA
jgi:hypothetical protein